MSGLNVMLTPNHVNTFTRPKAYGTPAYFGKVEWFDVVDRETNELLPWTVSRVDGGECVVNHPSEGAMPVRTLHIAAELIHGHRMPEVRARHLRSRPLCDCPDVVSELCSDDCKHRRPWGTGKSLFVQLKELEARGL